MGKKYIFNESYINLWKNPHRGFHSEIMKAVNIEIQQGHIGIKQISNPNIIKRDLAQILKISEEKNLSSKQLIVLQCAMNITAEWLKLQQNAGNIIKETFKHINQT